MVDASNMFENSNFEEIYFGTENNLDNKKRNLDETEDSNDFEDEEVEVEEEEEEEKEIFFIDSQSSNIDSISSISDELISVIFTSTNFKQPLNICFAFLPTLNEGGN